MFRGKLIILILAAAVSAQTLDNDQYDYQQPQGQRTPSFLASQRSSNNNFGVRAGLSSNSRSLNQNNQFGLNSNGIRTNTQSGTSQFGHSTQNNFGNTNSGRSSQFNRQSSLARNQQFGGTAEAGAQVLSERSENDGFGQYSYSYETDNGIKREETAIPNGQGTSAVSGSYSYISPEGVEVVVRYIADENGFQVESPNVPAIPLHAQEQIETAREAKARGLIDENGNPTSSDGFQSFNSNSQRSSNLQNLVSQNARFRSNNNNNQFGSQSGFANSQRNSNSRRHFNNNLSANSFGSQNLNSESSRVGSVGSRQDNDQFGSSFGQQNRGFSQLRQDNGQFGSSFGQQNRGFGQLRQDDDQFESSFGQQNRGFDQLRQDNQHFGSTFSQQNRGFGRTGQFVTPAFQRQINSRLSVQEGTNFRTASPDSLHGSQIPSTATGNVASYRVGS